MNDNSKSEKNIPIYSLKDFTDPNIKPIAKLIFLILQKAYFNDFKEIRFLLSPEFFGDEKPPWYEFLQNSKESRFLNGRLNVFNVKDNEELPQMILAPECIFAIFSFFKKITNWRDDISHLNQTSIGNVLLTSNNGTDEIVGIAFNVENTPPGVNCFIKISNKLK